MTSTQVAGRLIRLGLTTSRCTSPVSTTSTVAISCVNTRNASTESYKIVIVGGGTGGTAIAAKLEAKYGKQVAVIEPSDRHYYQAAFTLVGGGMMKLEDAVKSMESTMPRGVTWVRSPGGVSRFDPDANCLYTKEDKQINYEYLVVAMGHELHYNQVKGLSDGFEEDNQIVSNYSPDYVKRTRPALERLQEGTAIFTFPNTPVKCGGAPQKIMYIADDFLRNHGRRDKVEIIYNVAGPGIFPSPYYAAVLRELCDKRGIKVNYLYNLIEVKAKSREAVFQIMNEKEPKETVTLKYDLLHVSPPQSPPAPLKECKALVNAGGYLDLDKHTLRHVKYSNIFGIGDCTSLPTSKTAAAVASQGPVLHNNLLAAIDGKELTEQYHGYTSCPLVTGYSKCIMAEFDYDLNPLETFPFDQRKERKFMFYVKKNILPSIYWGRHIKGTWNGPSFYRKLLHLGFSK